MTQKILFFLILFNTLQLSAQKTIVFNGKTYLLYPQEIDKGNNAYSPYLYLDKNLRVGGVSFPPIIGSMPDGEYLIYTNSYNYYKRGRRKKTVCDTVQVVYGTFTIKNNQKQGDAVVYNRYMQTMVECRLHYENDLLQGNVIMNVVDDERYDRDRDYYNYYSKGNVLKRNPFAEVQFKEGLLSNQLSVYFIHDKDTFLSKRMEIRNSLRHGKYEQFHYLEQKKKVVVYSTVVGDFENGIQQGHWTYKRKSRIEDFKIYHSGEVTYRKHHPAYSDSNYYEMESFGRDSVLKYFPFYKSEKTKSSISKFYGMSFKDSFEVITYIKGSITHRAFRAYGKVSIDYGNDFDTLINGRLFRVDEYDEWNYKSKPRIIKNYFIVDTLLKEYYIYGVDHIFKEIFDVSHRYLNTVYYEDYTKYFFKDSLQGQLSKQIRHRRYTETEFYHQALDYSYTNIQYRKGQARHSSIYYKVSGGANNGSIIKYIKVPSHYDTIYLIDTLMRNGKFLYTYDRYFNFGYSDLAIDHDGYLERDRKMNIVTDQIYRFMEVKPIQHKTILLGNTMYTGRLNLSISYIRKPGKVKASVREYQENILDIFSKKLIIEMAVERRKSELRAAEDACFIIPSSYRYLYFENGLMNGNVYFKDLKNRITFESYYTDNTLSGSVQIRPHRFRVSTYDDDYSFLNASPYMRHFKYVKKIKRKNTFPVNGSLMQYDKGRKHGQWLMYYNGQIYQTYNFQNDNQNGLQNTFNTGVMHTISYVYTMKNDTVNGVVYDLYNNGMPERIGVYKMGLPHGSFIKYEEDSDTAKYLKKRFHFSNGFLTGDYVEYRDTDNLKMRITFSQSDSIFYDELELGHYRKDEDNFQSILKRKKLKVVKNMSGYEFLNQVFNQIYFRRGYYRYYYASGYLFKQGFKAFDQPVEQWQVFREGKDRLYKTIDFKDSMLFANTPDTLQTYGLVKAYYDNGQLMFTGLATDFNFKYSCESDADMPTENDYYLSFYDTLGRPLLVNGNGFISELQANGNKLKEGKIVNNKKEGVWIYYSKFGLAEEVGFYKNGLKTGRWLSGDLGGLNIDEKVCFMSDDEYRWWIKAFGGNLNLREEYYDNGKLVNTNSVNTVKK